MTRIVTPRTGTRTRAAMDALHRLGGQASVSTWHRAVMAQCRFGADDWDVALQQMLNSGLIYQRHEEYFMADAGRAWLGLSVDAPSSESWAKVGPRYQAPNRPLSAKNMTRLVSARDGSLDYRDIPSLFGARRVSHGSKA